MVYNKRTHIEQEVKLKERGVHQTLYTIDIKIECFSKIVNVEYISLIKFTVGETY